MLHKKLQELKERSNMTLQEISDKSDVPIATVKRIMSGQTPEPSFSTVISMIKAMDGSVSDVEEALVVNDNSENTNNSNIREERIVRLSDNDRLIRVYELSLMAKDRWIRNLTILCVAMVAIFVFLLIWDLCNPNIGFIRTQETIGEDIKNCISRLALLFGKYYK